MLIAIDASPTRTAHKTRGIGSYTTNIITSLKETDKDFKIKEFYSPKNPPRADIIHYPYFDLFFHSLPLRAKTTRVVTVHDVIPLVFPKHFKSGIKGKLNLHLQKLALKNTAAVLCDSQTSKKDIAQKLAYPAEKIHVIYLAPGKNFRKTNDQKLLEKVSQKYSLPKKFILYVGDINWNKNLPNLLKSIKLTGVNLVAVGNAIADANLEQTKSLTAQIESLGIQNKVRIVGYVPESDLVSIYNLAVVTVLPSFYEGFGLPVVESMACGTPVICSNNSSLAEIGGDAAIYCDPESPQNVSEQILNVINLSPGERAALENKSLVNASKFSWVKTAMETSKVYKSLRVDNE
ncbi:MAG: Glycosyl transferase group 1 [Candidatus Curtissbacteria bacterium GW2011_GWA1_40_16]|uniref:Glycosyl transferase group 1 n=1 Tax=Candidatus Curtissbacteria bacterium GW2011_GWA1_40_16 TaxID=1618405 RepID=A0A0G0UHJ5_9BACT|nr:MAG: Glycosyl transferase group 1 [Candidatus Curtissbacteria bacterium GW2011_GWA1_40_16]